MNLIQKFLNKRKQKRYYTHGHAYLVIQPYTEGETKVQVIDVSQGGCAFIYQGDRADIDESGFANLMTGDCLHLERAQYVVKSNRKAGEARRCGVEFKWLGSMDKKRLGEFCESAALCPCS
ncbi:MAG TPA: hypothetical protein DDY86_00205 [Syntrophaceae bacterium]|nr:hypothetical protein [Syntrophaceae bacterium]